jgi:hypothetical protein
MYRSTKNTCSRIGSNHKLVKGGMLKKEGCIMNNNERKLLHSKRKVSAGSCKMRTKRYTE